MTKYGEHCGTWQSFRISHQKRLDLGLTLIQSSTSPGGSFRQSTFSGSDNPNWRSIIRAGGNAGTPAGGTRYRQELGYVSDGLSFTPITNDGINGAGGAECYGVPSTMEPSYLASPSTDDVTSVENRALSKFLSQCDSVRSSIEGGQDIGELKQTLEAMINPMGSLRKHVLGYFDKLKKVRRIAKGPSLHKALADTYLEWTFGWKPLASDIAQAYVGLQNRKKMYSSVPVSSSASATYHGTVDSYSLWHSISSEFDHLGFVKSTSRYSVRYKGAVRTNAVNGSISAAQVLQLDLPHFLPTAWDLLPYSFIIDYFANVGDIISAKSFVSANIAWVVCTRRNECVREYAPLNSLKTNINPLLYQITSSFSGAARSKFSTVTFSRSIPAVDSLVPKFQFKLPFSHKPWENIGAIMASRSKSLVPFFK